MSYGDFSANLHHNGSFIFGYLSARPSAVVTAGTTVCWNYINVNTIIQCTSLYVNMNGILQSFWWMHITTFNNEGWLKLVHCIVSHLKVQCLLYILDLL